MHAMRSNSFRKVELLRQQLAERDAAIAERERIIAEKEEQLNERERVIAVRDAELYAKTLQIENLKAQLAILRRSRYGRSSEKLDQEIEQLELLLGELEEGVAEGRTRAEQIAKSPQRRAATSARVTPPMAVSRCQNICRARRSFTRQP